MIVIESERVIPENVALSTLFDGDHVGARLGPPAVKYNKT
jgi:hypothetical protein